MGGREVVDDRKHVVTNIVLSQVLLLLQLVRFAAAAAAAIEDKSAQRVCEL
jgi:hypothetical protein